MTRLPHDRPMTDAEKRGFRIACGCMATWGRQIEGSSFRLGGQVRDVPQHEVMRRTGRLVRSCAEALGRTLGS